MDEHDDPNVELWKLLVGVNDDFLLPNILSRVADVRDQDSAASLFAAALDARPKGGALKDNALALWLIDRLRTGVGWKNDIDDLNASFPDRFRDVEILQDGISAATLLMALLECFDPSEVSVRCALLHMAVRCALPVPVVVDAPWLLAETAIKTSTLLYIGGLAYTVPLAEHNRMVLLVSTTSIDVSRSDALLHKLFCLDERFEGSRQQDSLNENMIELFVDSPLVSNVSTGIRRTCQLLISYGRWHRHRQYIEAPAKVASAIVLSLTDGDIADDGSLCDDALQQLVATNQGRLICMFNRGSSGRHPSVSERNQITNLRKKQCVEEEDCFELPKDLTKRTPDLTKKFQDIAKAVLKKIDHARREDDVPVHWLDMQASLPSMYRQEWQKLSGFAAEVRKHLNDLKVDKQNSESDLRHQLFPFSVAAHNAAVSRNKRATELRRKPDADATALSVRIEDQERIDFRNAADAQPHPFFLLFLSHVMSPQHMFFFERELEVWKSTGAVANLRTHLEETKKKLDKVIVQKGDVKQLKSDVEKIYVQLDTVDWTAPDFWREIRSIKGLPEWSQRRSLLSPDYITMIRRKYASIFASMEEQDSMARSFLALFLRGMTVDVLDGSLLSVDEHFLREVFDRRLYQDSISTSADASQSYFIVSMLGVQSTGKSTLLNNLFGCNMPVSVGRTTRGMNVCHVQVNLPNSIIKHIVVQDYEGLMTMDRNDSLFDKDVCLQALATSDLVLVNTSKVIDAPTQQLLQYTAFAFHEMGLQKFRKLKPKLAFVLRDMPNGDTSSMAQAKRAMEGYIREGFIQTGKMKANLELSEFMELPEYIALSSAVHRRDPFWQQSLLNLRQFIFKTMTDLRKDALQGRSFTSWVEYVVASWECIRTNTGLLAAESLAELRLRNRMEEALHAALKSKGTVIKSETKIKGIIDSILKDKIAPHEQEAAFDQALDVEFQRCLRMVIEEFEAKTGGKESVPEPLMETWEEFRNQRIEKEVRGKKEHLRLRFHEKLQNKCTEVSMNTAVEAVVKTLFAEIPPSNKLNEAEATKRFEDALKPEESAFRSRVNEQYSKEKVKQIVDRTYVKVSSKSSTDQPNDFDDLVDMQKEDLTKYLKGVPLVVAKPSPRSSRSRAGTLLSRPLSYFSNHHEQSGTKEDVITNIQSQLNGAILLFSISYSSLQNDIETAVRHINAMIKDASQELDSAKLSNYISQLAKAAHRHLYRNIVGRVESLSRNAKEEQFEEFRKLMQNLRDNHVAKLTGMLNDRDLCNQITKGLSDAMVNEAVNPARLGLRRDDVPRLLRSHFSDISSPEKVEEILYDNLFTQKKYELLLDYIKNRSATTNSTWNSFYETGERQILRSANEQMGKTFSEPGCLFDRLKAATEGWFRQNVGRKKEPIRNLLKDLKKLFEFVDNRDLLALGYYTIDEVNEKFIINSWPETPKIIDKAKNAVKILVDGLRGPIKNSTYGCSELCPYCRTKCMHAADHVVSHECHRHLIQGFGGCYTKSFKVLDEEEEEELERHLTTSYCTGDAFDAKWCLHKDDDSSKSVSFQERMLEDNKNVYPTWKIDREDAKVPPPEQREAFKYLNQRIANHFGYREAKRVGWMNSMETGME